MTTGSCAAPVRAKGNDRPAASIERRFSRMAIPRLVRLLSGGAFGPNCWPDQVWAASTVPTRWRRRFRPEAIQYGESITVQNLEHGKRNWSRGCQEIRHLPYFRAT